MYVNKHHDAEGKPYITVEEALPIEQISAELFEISPRAWLRVWDFEDGPEGVFGKFSINARNGVWVYQLTRSLWWMPGVYEAKLVRGTVVRREVSSHS